MWYFQDEALKKLQNRENKSESENNTPNFSSSTPKTPSASATEDNQVHIPRVVISSKVVMAHLQILDPELYSHLIDDLKIESHLFLMRWTRLLFLREFGLDESMRVWDAIFASLDEEVDNNNKDGNQL